MAEYIPFIRTESGGYNVPNAGLTPIDEPYQGQSAQVGGYYQRYRDSEGNIFKLFGGSNNDINQANSYYSYLERISGPGISATNPLGKYATSDSSLVGGGLTGQRNLPNVGQAQQAGETVAQMLQRLGYVKGPQTAYGTYISPELAQAYQQNPSLIGQPNLINAGQGYVPGNISTNQQLGTGFTSPAIVSSEQARTATNQNINNLSQYEQNARQYTVKPGDTLSAIAQRMGVDISQISGYKSGDPNKIFPGENLSIASRPMPIAASSTNPTLQGMIEQANEIVSGYKKLYGELPQDIQQQLDAVNGIQTQQQADIAAARTAADNKDYAALDALMQRIKNAETQKNNSISELQSRLEPLRKEYIALQEKSQEEKNIEKQLADLRETAQKSNLTIESQPIAMTAIVGQQREQMKLFQAEEANLLARLGLAQENRQGKAKAKETELGFIADDINLQMKIQEKLDQEEEQALNRAASLRDDQRAFLSTLASSMADVDIDANPDVLRQVEQLAIQNGVSASLATQIVRSAHNQKVYENAKSGKTKDDLLTLDERKKLYPSLPLSLVGKSEQQVIADLESPTPPAWFSEVVGGGFASVNLNDPSVVARWQQFKQAALKEVQNQVQKGTQSDGGA